MIYETKGLLLEEVDEMYEKVDKAWKSEGFVPMESFWDGGNGKERRSIVRAEGKGVVNPEVDHSSEHTEG
jgi:SP family sugar:H+ symporter-like MFS transporter